MFFFLFLFGMISYTYAQPALVRTKWSNNNNKTNTATFTAASTSGNLIVVVVNYDNQVNSVATVADNKGNTYTRITNCNINFNAANLLRAEMWYAYNITGGGAAITVTATLTNAPTGGGLGAFSQMYIAEFSGIITASDPLDQSAATAGTTATPSSGNLTPLYTNELVFGASINGGSGAISKGASFTQVDNSNGNMTEWMQSGTGGGTVAADFSCASTSDWMAQGATFISTTSSCITCVASVTGNWNAAATWASSGTCSALGSTAKAYPGTGSTVTICDNKTVTIPASVAAVAATVNIQSGSTGDANLTLASGTTSLTLSGNMLIKSDGNGDYMSRLTVNSTNTVTVSGTLTVYGYHNGSSKANATVVLAGGTVVATGAVAVTADNGGCTSDITFAGNDQLKLGAAGAAITFTGTSATINNPTAAAGTSGTIEYNNAGAQTVASAAANIKYNDLILSTGGVKSLNAAVTINGDLTISNSASLDVTGSSYGITFGGDWTNNSSAASGFQQQVGTVTFSGTSGQQILGTASTAFWNLTLNNASGLTLATSPGIATSVYQTLTMTSGTITIGNFDLNIGYAGGSGSIASSSSAKYIITNGTGSLRQYNVGTGQRTSVLYPIGVSSSSYTPLTLTVVGATTVDDFKGRVSQNVLVSGTSGSVITTKSVDKTWDITEGTVGGSNVTLTIQWNLADEQSGFTRSVSYISHYTGGIWVPTSAAAAAAGSNPYTRVSGTVTSFSQFGMGSNGMLPIELLKFDAKPVENRVNLTWATATETNNDYFTIERSMDGIMFVPVITQKGAGNSSKTLYYSAVDSKPLAGVSYYRLKQTDFDGKYTYSNVISVDLYEQASVFTVYPNPSVKGDTPQLKFNADETKEILVVVSDVNGKEVFSKVSIIEKGKGQIVAIDPSNTLAAGVYVISASSDNSVYRQKLIIR